MDAKGEEIMKLRRDNYDRPGFWILTDGYRVSVAAQKNGESPTGKVTMPLAEFNRLIRWYTKDQKPLKRKR